MQYQPEGYPTPPSSKYQSHLPFRVDQHTINAAVERRGVYCTHVDALRYFAPAAKSWNQFGEYGTNLSRKDQITLEQPACVHANMDLLKYAVTHLHHLANVDPHVSRGRAQHQWHRLSISAIPTAAISIQLLAELSNTLCSLN